MKKTELEKIIYVYIKKEIIFEKYFKNEIKS